ncbi:MAG: type II toxin-antitoxin system PemK/MazF family toxin, partial [Sulfurimonas sp.]|nr:type II toxin-antitoxin system PemK/MazF family toxin [Sulfurimonas sp.]
IRSALIIQNDIANRNIDKVEFKGVTVIPLTTNISGGNLRIKIDARDKLIYESEICINELCTLDISRIELQNIVTTLTNKELEEVNSKLLQHLGL